MAKGRKKMHTKSITGGGLSEVRKIAHELKKDHPKMKAPSLMKLAGVEYRKKHH